MNNEKLTCRAAGGSCDCSNSDAITCPVPDSLKENMNQQDKAAPTAPPVAAPVASIETPDFRCLIGRLIAAKSLDSSDRECEHLIAHIDAAMVQHGQEQFQAGLKHAHQQALTVTHALMAERDAAKASLARLVEACTVLREEILHGIDGMENHQTNSVLDVFDHHTYAVLKDFLPAKAENGWHGPKHAIPSDEATPAMGEYCAENPEQLAEVLERITKEQAMGEELPDLPDLSEEWSRLEKQAIRNMLRDYGRACMALRQPGAAFNERAAMKCQVNEFSSKVCERGVKGCHISHGNNPYVSAFDQGRATAPVSQPAVQDEMVLRRFGAHDMAGRLALWLSSSMDQHTAVDEMRKHIRTWIDYQIQPITAPAGSEQEEQAEFERATLEKYPAADFSKYPTGRYETTWVQDHWCGWQDRAALAAQQKNGSQE